jgi:hypothetical protein
MIVLHADVAEIFSNETGGFDEHPADLLDHGPPNNDTIVLLEKMGVSDPESVSGHALTASALQNLPDLVLHCTSEPVPEYNNSDLIPGMFPTLFPFGIGGFEDKTCKTPIAFQQQAQYYLNLHDCKFHYHFSLSLYCIEYDSMLFTSSSHPFYCDQVSFQSYCRKTGCCVTSCFRKK